MLIPEHVQKIFNLHSIGWGKKRIAKELGVSNKTVRRYLSQKEWVPYSRPQKRKKLEGLAEWLEQTFYLQKVSVKRAHLALCLS